MIGRALIASIREEPTDKIWQESIALNENISDSPNEVWQTIVEALDLTKNGDTIAAIATCLLEHLLEQDFTWFGSVAERVQRGDDKLLYALSVCSKFGESTKAENSSRWNRMLEENARLIDHLRRLYD